MDICIATITWARDRREEDLIGRSLTALSTEALPIVVADGGSSSEFLGSLRRVPHLTVVQPEARGLIHQIKASLSAAANLGPRFILYAESDKLMFFEQKLERFLSEARSADDVGVAIAARDEESLSTYPRTQQIAESAINTLTGEFTGAPGDYSYGPFLLHRSLAAHVERLRPEVGWGWRHYLFAVAARLGHRIVHVVDDLPCPEDQRGEDAAERSHRLKQLAQNVNGLLLGIDSALGSSDGTH